MPTYEAECTVCGACFEYMSTMTNCRKAPRCECGGRAEKVVLTAPTCHGDLDDFSSMNGGRGMWNDQLNTYVKSTQDVIDKGKAKGLKPIG